MANTLMDYKAAKRLKVGTQVRFSDGMLGKVIETGYNAVKIAWDDGQVGIIHLDVERAELGIDGNCGFALLGTNLQEGEAEFVEIALPAEASKHPDRYHHSEWVTAAKIAASTAYRRLKARLPDRKFSYFLGTSHPDHI